MLYVLGVSFAILCTGVALAFTWLWLLRKHCGVGFALRTSFLYFGLPILFLLLINWILSIDNGGAIFSFGYIIIMETWKLFIARRQSSAVYSLAVIGLSGAWEAMSKALTPWLHPITFSEIIYTELPYITILIVVSAIMHGISAIIYSRLRFSSPLISLFIGSSVAVAWTYISWRYIFPDYQASIGHGALIITALVSIALLSALWRSIAVEILRRAHADQDQVVFS
jgi:hypothetical protein